MYMSLTKYGGAIFMLGIMSLFDFIKDFFFLFGYVTNYNLFPEPLSQEEEMYYLELLNQGDE